MSSRYRKQHYEDVARILSKDARTVEIVTEDIARDFADLFAEDNPPFCRTCDVTHTIFYAGEGLHEYEGGFNRADFLAACGLAEEVEADESED